MDIEKPTLAQFEIQSDQERLDLARRRKRLLAHIRSSRADFTREFESRRRLLGTLEPQVPSDPLVAEIEKQWNRLFEDYRRYRRAVPYPGERRGWR